MIRDILKQVDISLAKNYESSIDKNGAVKFPGRKLKLEEFSKATTPLALDRGGYKLTNLYKFEKLLKNVVI